MSKCKIITAVGVIAAALSLAPALAQSAPIKIGVFDAQRMSVETNEGKAIQTRLDSLRNAKQGELTIKENELKALQDQLSAQALSLSDDRRMALENEIQRKLLELNQFREAATRELQLQIAEAQGQFEKQLLVVIDEFARAEGFHLILEVSTVVHYAQTIDVTTAIVDRYNARFPSP